jgi:hypothetical protein
MGNSDDDKCFCDVTKNSKRMCSATCVNGIRNKPCKTTQDCKPKEKRGGGGSLPAAALFPAAFTPAVFDHMTHAAARKKALQVYDAYRGKRTPSRITWDMAKQRISEVEYRNVDGFDVLTLHNDPWLKLHPYQAPVYVVAGKYIHVPSYLLGPLKYASETINIEQLRVPKKESRVYHDTGKRTVALVTGSCASLTISAITVKFVEDMIKTYARFETFAAKSFKAIHAEFRKEYDRRVADFLCGRGIQPSIPWFTNRVEKTEQKAVLPPEQCRQAAAPGFPGSVIAERYDMTQ